MRRARPILVAAALLGQMAAGAPPAAAAVTVALDAPAEGAAVTGVVAVSASADPSATSVTFDWSADDGATWTAIGTDTAGGDGWTASWDTRPYTGSALLRATATDGLTTASDTNTLTVDNLAPVVTVEASNAALSPNGDGRKDRTTIRVTAGEPVHVALRLLDARGTPRREWSQELPAAGDAEFEWDGTADGTPLPDGAYAAAASATDRVGLTGEATGTLTLDTLAPRAAWLGVSPEPATGLRPIRFRFHTDDDAAGLRAAVELLDRVGRVGRRETDAAPGGGELRWKPASRARPLFPGLYLARLTVTDPAGNRSVRRETRFRVLRPVRARVFRRLEGAGRRVAITIDDCHIPEAWGRMLTVLRRHDVRATFFCPGNRMLLFPHLARRTVREGHLLASHGWDHAALAGRGFTEAAWRLRRDVRVAWRLARDTTAPYYRPAYGSHDAAVVAAAGATGHPRVIMWDVSAGDTGGPGAAAIVRGAVGPARRGSIILMHTIGRTADALAAIIRGLRRKGLRPVTLAELFRAAGYR